MGTREVLVKRADVRNDDIDDIIGIAAELQEQERRDAEGASASDVASVAAELDIDPAYVDAAIGQLKLRREQAARAAETAAREAAEHQARTRRVGLIAAGVTAVLAAVFALGLGGVATLADSRLDTAANDQQRASANLSTVLQRQATLAPQLVALAGGPTGELTALADALREATTVEDQLRASDALGTAMATQLGRLPPPTDAATAQSRADLQHEVSGITNRITVERRRYDEATLVYEQAQQGLGASLAMGLGLH